MAWRNKAFRPVRETRQAEPFYAQPYYEDDGSYPSAKFSPGLVEQKTFRPQEQPAHVNNYYAEAVVSENPAVGAGRYQGDQEILIVGDDNFSFSRALVYVFGTGAKLLTTSHDDKEALMEKYGHQRVSVVLDLLERLGTRVLHGVSGTQLLESVGVLDCGLFDRVVFNFPHALSSPSEKQNNVSSNQSFLRQFFASAHTVLKPEGEVHVALAACPPFDDWNILQQAWECRMVLTDVREFRTEDYEGYKQPYTGAADGGNRVVDLLFVFTPAPNGRKAPHKPEAVSKAQSYGTQSPCCAICKLWFRDFTELNQHASIPSHLNLKQLLPSYMAYLDPQSPKPVTESPNQAQDHQQSQAQPRQTQPAQRLSQQLPQPSQPPSPFNRQTLQKPQPPQPPQTPQKPQPPQPPQQAQRQPEQRQTPQGRLTHGESPTQLHTDVFQRLSTSQRSEVRQFQSEQQSHGVIPVRDGPQNNPYRNTPQSQYDQKVNTQNQSQASYLNPPQRAPLQGRLAQDVIPSAPKGNNFAVPVSPRVLEPDTRNSTPTKVSIPRNGPNINGAVVKIAPGPGSNSIAHGTPNRLASSPAPSTAALRAQNVNTSMTPSPKKLLTTTAALQAARAAKLSSSPSPSVTSPSTAATRSFANIPNNLASSAQVGGAINHRNPPANPASRYSQSPVTPASPARIIDLTKASPRKPVDEMLTPSFRPVGSGSASFPGHRETLQITNTNNVRSAALGNTPSLASNNVPRPINSNTPNPKQSEAKATSKSTTMDLATWKRVSAGIEFKCDVCRVGCTSKVSLDTHLAGQLHLSNTARIVEASPPNTQPRVVSLSKRTLQTPSPVSKLVESPSVATPTPLFDENPMSPSLSGVSANPTVSVLDAIFEEPELTIRRARTPVVKRRIDLEREDPSKMLKDGLSEIPAHSGTGW